MSEPAPSLKRSLLRRLLTLQGGLLVAFGLLVALGLYGTHHAKDEDNAVEVLQAALVRDAAGGLALRTTPQLRELREEIPDLWYVIRDENGEQLSHGPVPPAFARIGGALDRVNQARLGWQFGDSTRLHGARFKRVDTDAGRVRILTTDEGRVMTPAKIAHLLLTAFVSLILPALALMSLVTLIATPIVVRRALRSLDRTAAHARDLDVERRGARLPEAGVPSEVRPLVSAMNDALGRYDQSYERHKRFLADAAHELRTPIAILNARLESLPPSPDRARLLEDVARLSVMAEQLLDLQRIGQRLRPFEPVDLVALGRRVAADLAPLAIAGGYELSFESERWQALVQGDPLALSRALTNLVQNAIEHGGRAGTIAIRVCADGSVEVCDEGPGIPEEHRQRIFEPFYRLHPNERGAGLGLNLVSEIVRLHRGHIAVLDAPGGGACFRFALPPAPDPAPAQIPA